MNKVNVSIKEDRISKLEEIKKLGVNPFPSKVNFKREPILDAIGKDGKEVAVAGRLLGWRGHGNVIFADLVDESGKMQIFFQKKSLGEDFKFLKLVDVGDFFAVRGKVFKTVAGEISIDVAKFQLLTKSLRPLPSMWYGLKDEEERYRRRYVDLILNEDLKGLFRKKALFWQSMRNLLIEKGFLEVETPVLENTAGGADANPFVTHHNALDIDLFLRISMGELWQKRLMVGGFEKTFEIGRQFRNEGISREHLQDYTQMEFYWGYANYEDSMALVEELYKYVAKETFGKLTFDINGHKVNLGKAWEKIDYTKTIKEKTGVDISKASEKDIKEKLDELKVEYDKKDGKSRLIDSLWKYVRKSVSGPAFLVGHPVEISPLAKRMEDNPDFVERYQVILAGSEMGNGYSELNDPIDQKARFEEQQDMRDKGDDEAQMEDNDFVRALEYGMPPVSGFGVSERLFSFLADLPIRESVLFPLLRPESKNSTGGDKHE
ncbi:MAG: lysine--tRNA ligase [Microgenomates group bacterium]